MAKDCGDGDTTTENQYCGSLVAFEGPADVVSTQLRMLPISPQVLILPGVRHYMAEDSNARFDARSYIKDVLKAVQTRRKVALQFLSQSSTESKRLVFLNGGTAGAVSQCILAIAESQAFGDVLRAEATFRGIASEGAKGLGQEKRYSNQETLGMLGGGQGRHEPSWEDEGEDPITRAMRAADALYEETESLQPIDCYIRTRPRSLSLPMLGYTNDLGEASPFFVFGSPPNEETGSNLDMDEDELTSYSRAAEEDAGRSHVSRPPMLGISIPDRPLSSVVGEAIRARHAEARPATRLISPTTDHCLSPPITPEGVVYGEARLVQMQATKSQKPLRKIQSLDEMELNEARSRRVSVQTTHSPEETSSIESQEAKSRHLSILEDPYSSNNLLHLPQARFVKAHTTTIKRSPVFEAVPDLTRDTYIHQGTESLDVAEDDEPQEAFQPVLPLHEDLVIHFTSETPENVLDSVIQSFKDGSYPVAPAPADSFETAETDSCPSTPRTADLFDLEDSQIGLSPVMEVPSGDEAEEYDPFAVHGAGMQTSTLSLQTQSLPLVIEVCPPPTPAQTPLPPGADSDSRFHDFSTAGRANAVATQNALRLVLEAYFPPQHEGGYHKFNSTLLDRLDSLWRPIFGDSETHDGKSTGKTADLILAIGCQKGVKREFSSALTGQIEKLGTKSNGMSRSGRLDIRYLIVTAMQSFSTQPLTRQTRNNPFDNPHLLACLIIPQLETYLAASATTRFLLLEYPTEHLATVLALQEIVGSDMLKIAGIIDSEAASPTTSESVASLPKTTAQHSNPVARSLDTIILPGSPFPNSHPQGSAANAHRRHLSFSRANYLLTSSATDAEITAFISKIWRILIEVDPYYVPEQTQVAYSAHMLAIKPPLPGLVSRFTSPCSPPLSPPGLPLPPPPRMTRDESPSRGSDWSGSGRGGLQQHIAIVQQQQQQHGSGASVASSSPRSLHRLAGMLGTPRREPDNASADAVSVAEEGDCYDDEEERRLMPMYMRQSELRKGNSRKALRWLGLA